MSHVEAQALTTLLEFLRRQRGVDFKAYKSSSLERRLQHRMHTVGFTAYSEYLDHLQATPEELNALLDTLFINVTRFFRDKPAWDALAAEVIPPMLAANQDQPIRVWCAGVASGEEAFSLAILLAEAMGADAFRDRAKIFATDADDGALSHGRAADYTDRQIADIPEALRGYFDAADGHHVFRPELRRSVIFGRHNLLEDAPISRLDMLICRNTLMYFNRESQSRILARFHFALKDDGALFLGKAETLLTRRHLFSPIDAKVRIFRKVPQFGMAGRFPSIAKLESSEDGDGDEGAKRSLFLRHFAFHASPVAHMLIDHSGKLAFANEAARATFGVSESQIGRPFAELEVSYRPIDLRTVIDHARALGKAVTVPAIERPSPLGRQVYDVVVAPLRDGGNTETAFGITFTDVTTAHELRAQLEASKGELETAYEELQSTNEELETTNEELQSTIEELETTNEELQSTNEELETMNEELQSTNDEIRVINDQLTDRGSEVDRLSAYFRSIVDGQQVTVIVLDAELNVSMWNRKARDMWGLQEDEVRRQPIMNLDIGLPVHRLRDAMRRVLRDEAASEEGIISAHDRKGKPFECRVVITPLRGIRNETSGVILTMEAVDTGMRDATQADETAAEKHAGG